MDYWSWRGATKKRGSRCPPEGFRELNHSISTSSSPNSVKRVKFAEEKPTEEEEMKSKSRLSYCEHCEAESKLEQERYNEKMKAYMCTPEETERIMHQVRTLGPIKPLDPERLEQIRKFADEHNKKTKADWLKATNGLFDGPCVMFG